MPAIIDTPTANPRMTRTEAAEYLGLSPETLATWATRGGGPQYIKAGRRVIYLQRDLDTWMDARRMSCTTDGE